MIIINIAIETPRAEDIVLPIEPVEPTGSSMAFNSASGARNTEPDERMTDLSMKFSSSRIFPGQLHCVRDCMVSAGMVSMCLPMRRE